MASFEQLKSMLTLESEPGPFLSIFVPAEQAHAKPENYKQTINDFKNKIDDEISEQGSSYQWNDYEDKFNQIHLPRFFNKRRTKGFAIYIGPTMLKIFKVEHPIDANYFVGDTMKIIDLLSDAQFKHLNRSKTLFKAALKNIKVHYDQSQQMKQTTSDPNEIINAVSEGDVDTLLINDDAPVNEKNTLFNDLAITTIGKGGHVFILKNEHMPVNKGICIIKR